MQLSFTTLATPELPGVHAIRLAGKYGYQGIDLRVSEARGELTLAATDQQITEITTALADEGVCLASLLAYNDTAGAEESSWRRMEESIKRHLHLAARAGALSVRISLGARVPGMEAERYAEKLRRSLSRALEQSSGCLRILIQNHYHNLNAAECCSLIRQLDHPRLGFALSTDHCLIQNDRLEEILPQAKSIARQLYVADIIRREQGYDDVLPGTGEAPLQDIYEGIGGRDFEGWITLKWEKYWRPALAGYETVLPFFVDYFRKLDKEGKR